MSCHVAGWLAFNSFAPERVFGPWGALEFPAQQDSPSLGVAGRGWDFLEQQLDPLAACGGLSAGSFGKDAGTPEFELMTGCEPFCPDWCGGKLVG